MKQQIWPNNKPAVNKEIHDQCWIRPSHDHHGHMWNPERIKAKMTVVNQQINAKSHGLRGTYRQGDERTLHISDTTCKCPWQEAIVLMVSVGGRGQHDVAMWPVLLVRALMLGVNRKSSNASLVGINNRICKSRGLHCLITKRIWLTDQQKAYCTRC